MYEPRQVGPHVRRPGAPGRHRRRPASTTSSGASRCSACTPTTSRRSCTRCASTRRRRIYAEFGPFFTGLVAPVDEVLDEIGVGLAALTARTTPVRLGVRALDARATSASCSSLAALALGRRRCPARRPAAQEDDEPAASRSAARSSTGRAPASATTTSPSRAPRSPSPTPTARRSATVDDRRGGQLRASSCPGRATTSPSSTPTRCPTASASPRATRSLDVHRPPQPVPRRCIFDLGARERATDVEARPVPAAALRGHQVRPRSSPSAPIGLSLIFGTTGLVNFAHGELVTWGAIVAWFLNVDHGIHLVPAAVARHRHRRRSPAPLLDRGLWRPLRSRGMSLVAMMIVSIGLGLAARNVFQLLFGGTTRPYDDYNVQRAIRLSGPITHRAEGPLDRSCIVARRRSSRVALVAAAHPHRQGDARRVRQPRPGRVVGHRRRPGDPVRVGVRRRRSPPSAGSSSASSEQVQFDMGFQLLLLMFAGITLGGLGTAYGALVGSLRRRPVRPAVDAVHPDRAEERRRAGRPDPRAARPARRASSGEPSGSGRRRPWTGTLILEHVADAPPSVRQAVVFALAAIGLNIHFGYTGPAQLRPGRLPGRRRLRVAIGVDTFGLSLLAVRLPRHPGRRRARAAPRHPDAAAARRLPRHRHHRRRRDHPARRCAPRASARRPAAPPASRASPTLLRPQPVRRRATTASGVVDSSTSAPSGC